MSKYNEQLKALEEVRAFPPYKSGGLIVEVAFNNSVVLSSGVEEDQMSHRLSKEDSDRILNIITMSIKEVKDEESMES